MREKKCDGILRRSFVANVYADGLTLAAQKVHARFQRGCSAMWLVCMSGGDIYVTRDVMPAEQVQLMVAREPRALMGEEYTRTYPLDLVLRDLRTQRDQHCVRPERMAA